MASTLVCDICQYSPLDRSAPPDGDVRRVDIVVHGRPGACDKPEERHFDACADCRVRLLGAVFEYVKPVEWATRTSLAVRAAAGFVSVDSLLTPESREALKKY